MNAIYKYNFSWYDTDFELEFTPGDESVLASPPTRYFTSDSISLENTNFVSSFENDVPIGLEQLKSLEIEFDTNEIFNNVESGSDLADIIVDGTSATSNTISIHSNLAIPFDFGNRIKITDTTNNIIIFEGIQDLQVEKKFDGDKYKCTYECIGAKTLIALRPIFDELGMSYNDIVSNNWLEDHTELAIEGEISSNLFTRYASDSDSDYRTFVSKSLNEIKTAINDKCTKILKVYRRDTTSTFEHVNWFDRAIEFFESSGDKVDNNSPKVAISNADVRLICLDGTNQDYSEGKGLLGTDSDSFFGQFDNTYELYKNLTTNFLTKATFSYTTSKVSLEFKTVLEDPIYKTFSNQECEEIQYEANSPIIDFAKIKETTTTTEIDGKNKDYKIIREGVKNNTFYDANIILTNAYDEVSDSLSVRTISSNFVKFVNLSSNPSSRFYTTFPFNSVASKISLIKLSDHTRIYLNILSLTYYESTSTSNSTVVRNNESCLQNALNKAVEAMFESNQSFIKIQAPYEIIDPTFLGEKVAFSDLGEILNSNYLHTKINNEFTVVSYEFDFEGYPVIGLFGNNSNV